MLHGVFDNLKQAHGEDFFVSHLKDEVIRNLNPKFDLREYQKEALGRFDFYMSGEYQGRQNPTQLLFHMATGSGKTLIMAANILQLYKQGYRNFVFFVNSTNTIEKTRNNFLNPLSSKYLFADEIKFGEKKVQVREVDTFHEATSDDINIIFTTIQGLHYNLNNPQEDTITYEDFEERQVVFISDEAHHINALTKMRRNNDGQQQLLDTENVDLSKLSSEERKEVKSWEGTVERILNADTKNVLLEFTATINLGHTAVREKYEDKIIFQYDLKQFRVDGFSKEVNVLQTDLSPMDRALQALVVSQYRRKIAENNNIALKPVVLFKSKTIRESEKFKYQFDKAIKNLKAGDISKFKKDQNGIVRDAFAYFKNLGVTPGELAKEIQAEFNEERSLLLDSNNINEEKQKLLNNLEDKNNEVRALFAVDMLNEGWDVLNLFDIVRLYETRDAKANRPGSYTNKEAQLIGRGARYYPFSYDEYDKYKRKFDNDLGHELRPLEELHYHSMQDHRYIAEIKTALQESGIMEEEYKEVQLNVKDGFKESDFWKSGVVFANDRIENDRKDIKSLQDAQVPKEYTYSLHTGHTSEEGLLDDQLKLRTQSGKGSIRYKLTDFGEHVVRAGMDKLEFYRFDTLTNYFPHVGSRVEFVTSKDYLGGVSVVVYGPQALVEDLPQQHKLNIVVYVLEKIANEARAHMTEYKGTKTFKPHQLKDVFKDKVIKITNNDNHISGMETRDWYAQNTLYGTSEEEGFINFLESIIGDLKKQYDHVVLLRNEQVFAIYDFEEGRRFEPDFLFMLRDKKSKKVLVHQVLIEPKGNQFKDSSGGFEQSKESWKQEFLLQLEGDAETNYKPPNKEFRILGLPFYNKGIESEFEEAFKDKLL